MKKAKEVRRNALRNSLIPVATSVAFSVPGIFTGAVMTERIFAWQGMGQYLIQTIDLNYVLFVVVVAAFGAAMTAVSAILADLIVV
ncbi:ABC transporter permease subunit, partial [Lactobacillus delbrueckii subsp. lactis]|uniref:ABC transporter permease subunit n=1 Tax=Lactobacillus delbrueckii TaxID=1584 RepID=UPI0035D0B9F6